MFKSILYEGRQNSIRGLAFKESTTTGMRFNRSPCSERRVKSFELKFPRLRY